MSSGCVCDRVESRGSSVRAAGTKGVERSGSVWCVADLWTRRVDEGGGREGGEIRGWAETGCEAGP
jgi:hypothetical protein